MICNLINIHINEYVKILSINLNNDLNKILSDIGIRVNEKIKILRKAPFNGPLHIRTEFNAEFAIDFHIAKAIFVESNGEW